MAVSKVDLADGRTLIDLTGDTVTADKVAQGYTGHLANGEPFVGTAVIPDETVKQVTTNVGRSTQSITFSGVDKEPREWFAAIANNSEFEVGTSSTYFVSASSITNIAMFNKYGSSIKIRTSTYTTAYVRGNFTITFNNIGCYFSGGCTYTLYYKT